jgi:hypothetical protein
VPILTAGFGQSMLYGAGVPMFYPLDLSATTLSKKSP